MKKIIDLIVIMIVIVLINTCAISFSGKQSISFVEENQLLSNNESSNVDSNSVNQHKPQTTSVLNGNKLK